MCSSDLPLEPKHVLHPVGHLHLDLVKEAGRRVIERVVEVKHPCVDMCEILAWHVPRPKSLGRAGQAVVLD